MVPGKVAAAPRLVVLLLVTLLYPVNAMKLPLLPFQVPITDSNCENYLLTITASI